jgi:hypothetical protein
MSVAPRSSSNVSRPIVQASRSHTNTHPVGLLWTSDQLIAQDAMHTKHNKLRRTDFRIHTAVSEKWQADTATSSATTTSKTGARRRRQTAANARDGVTEQCGVSFCPNNYFPKPVPMFITGFGTQMSCSAVTRRCFNYATLNKKAAKGSIISTSSGQLHQERSM